MKKNKPLVLFWHSVYPDDTCPKYTDSSNPTASLFRDQLRFIVNHYTPISVFDFMRIVERKNLDRSITRPPVLLTFDDGFRNVITQAVPILNEFKAPAIFFVIGEVLKNPDFVPWFAEVKHLLRKTAKGTIYYGNVTIDLARPGTYGAISRLLESYLSTCKSQSDRQEFLNRLADELEVTRPRAGELDEDQRFITKSDLVRVESSSLLTIASHGMTHCYLNAMTYEEQVYELEESDCLLSQNCPSYYPAIAYPSGRFNADTIAIASRIYKSGFAIFLGASHSNQYAYPRVGICQDSVNRLGYTLSPVRRNYILPLKGVLHATGIRKVN